MKRSSFDTTRIVSGLAEQLFIGPRRPMLRCAPSFIRTVTVGPGISPGRLPLGPRALAGFTAGGDFHPALKARLVIFRAFVGSHFRSSARRNG